MSTRKKTAIAAFVIAVIAITSVIFINREKLSPGGKKGPEDAAAIAFAVETDLCRTGELIDYIRINGDVIAARSIDIYPDASGKLKNLKVSIGDYVRNNQVIAEIDPSRPGLSYALSPVRSTITGTVTSLPFEEGATVSVSTPVATIGDLTMLQVKSEISEQYAGSIKKGTRAELSFVAWPGRKYSGRVVEVSPVVNPSTRTMSIKLEFEKNYPEIKAGMFASIRLFTETKNSAVLVKSDAVVLREGLKYVFVTKDGKAVMRKVETGLTVDGVTEIVSGLAEGEEIVVRGQNLLDDGVDINVIRNSPLNGNGRS